MNIQSLIKPFERKNPSEWLDDLSLRELYEETSGPYGSPDPVECYILYELAKNTNGHCLEFGSWKGRSASFITQGIHDSKNRNRRLFAIDWFLGDETGGANPDKNEMIATLKVFDLYQYVVIKHANMLEIDYSGLDNVSLVFYDSDHNTNPTVNTLTKIHPCLNKDAIIIIHDASWVTTIAAIGQLSNLYEYIEMLDVWEGLAILRKKEI